MTTARPLLLAAALAASLVAPALASDWPQWRGPRRDGSAAALPDTLPSQPRRLWSVEVGTGHSSPIVVGNRVFQFAREDGDEILRALDLETGAEIWRVSEEVSYTRNPAAFMHGKGPKSTPVAGDGRVCAFGIRGHLFCVDGSDGRLLWRHTFEERWERTWPDFGTAASPSLETGLLVVHVGGVEAGSLSAFDPATGEVRWGWDEDPPAYSSPVLVELDGVEQIVTYSRNHLVSVSPTDGSLNWKTGFRTAYDQNSVTPMAVGDLLVVSGLDNGVRGLRVRREASERWLVDQIWRNDEVPMYMSSPVAAGEILFGLSDKRKGMLFCLDAATGELLWTTEGREGDNAALLLAGDRLVVLSTEGELQIGPASRDGWAPELRWEIAESATWAHPALVGDVLLVKDKTHLTAWSLR